MADTEWKLDSHQAQIVNDVCQRHQVDVALIRKLMAVELDYRSRGSMRGVLGALGHVLDEELGDRANDGGIGDRADEDGE